MRWLSLASVLLLVCCATPAVAQKPTVTVRPVPAMSGQFSMGELTPTPEMWFYEQALRQYQDPKTAVRTAAEFRADQRQRRLAAQKWFGVSNQRPRASVDGIHSDYSPGWSSGDANYPNRWRGVAGIPMILR